MRRLGIVSDTHGQLRPEVSGRLRGCDRILHAGDVGDPVILDDLAEIAPVEAVRGNVDHGPSLGLLPASIEGTVEGVRYRMIHRREDAAPEWSRDCDLVIFGHSHRPEIEWHRGCLWLNPGAAGPRRFRLPLTLAIVTVDGQRLIPELLALEPTTSAPRSSPASRAAPL
ncbi:MAG: metallophosphatase family protein [Holophagales bacterium]|nr:metallophosphatase family protein [Holophagales bacterium]